MPEPAPYAIGIDLGGTKIEGIVLDADERECFRHRMPTPGDGPGRYDAILEAVIGLVEMARSAIPAQAAAVGIGIPGTLDRRSQTVINANTTCLAGRPFRSDLATRLGQPVAMANDANCFTLAESRWGAGRGFPVVFGVIMGTGCGGGVSIDGHIRTGPHGIAGEWGHVAISPDGARCYCGNRGCVETLISGSGVENAYLKKFGARRSMADIVEGYRGGDNRCADIFETFIDDFGRCLGGLISILDPDAVVLGGGLSHIDELYTRGIEKVRRYAFHPEVQTPVLKNHLGDAAGVLGAAWIGRTGAPAW